MYHSPEFPADHFNSLITSLILSSFLSKKTYGYDISDNMIALAKKKYNNVTFTTKFDEIEIYKYDVITSFCVFHLIPNPVSVLEKLYNLLYDNGLLFLVIPICNNPNFIKSRDETIKKYSNLFKIPVSQQNNSIMREQSSIKTTLIEIGFIDIDISNYQCRNPFYDKKNLVSWCVGTLSANWNIPFEHSFNFFTDLVERYIELRPTEQDSDGFVHLEWEYIYVVARK